MVQQSELLAYDQLRSHDDMEQQGDFLKAMVPRA